MVLSVIVGEVNLLQFSGVGKSRVFGGIVRGHFSGIHEMRVLKEIHVL